VKVLAHSAIITLLGPEGVLVMRISTDVSADQLADRSVFLTLEPIPEKTRQTELEFWAAFEKDRPRIFGALLDMVVHGLRYLPNVKLDRTPRMADFARWGVACERAVWKVGSFLDAYNANRQDAVETVLEADIVATVLRGFVTAAQPKWKGTATKLLEVLTASAGETIAKTKEWPKTPRTVSGRLRRASTFLRKVGIKVSFDRTGTNRDITMIKTGVTHGDANDADPSGRPQSQDQSTKSSSPRADKAGNFASFASCASLPEESQADGSDAGMTHGEAPHDASDASCVTATSLKSNDNDANDADDAKNPPFSGCPADAALEPAPDDLSIPACLRRASNAPSNALPTPPREGKFRVVDATPPGTRCVVCHEVGTEPVLKIPPATPGAKTETLHERCAKERFQ
jgi:hypothetical protein